MFKEEGLSAGIALEGIGACAEVAVLGWSADVGDGASGSFNRFNLPESVWCRGRCGSVGCAS